MSKASEVRKLVKDAESQGFSAMITGSGHWKMTAPDHITDTPSGKRYIHIAHSPRSDRGVTSARARLRQIGYRPPNPPKPKQTDKEEGSAMPKLGDVVRVKGGGKNSAVVTKKTKNVLPVDQILDDVHLAAWLVWDHIHAELSHEGLPRKLGGLHPGIEWLGSRNQMIRRIWPELDPPDYSVEPAAMPEETRQISRYLSASKNMAVLHRGNVTRKTLWWVSKEWNEVEAGQLRDLPGNWWESKVTSQEAGEDREPAPVVVTRVGEAHEVHTCPDCMYASKSLHGVRTHISRMRIYGKEHPQGRYECPMGNCPEIRPDAGTMADHVSRDHRGAGLHICRSCGAVFTNRYDLNDHRMNDHRQESAVAADAGAADAALDSAETDPEPAPVLVQAPAPELATNPVQYLQALIDENVKMREELAGMPGLLNRLAELEHENAQLRAKQDQIMSWLNQYPFLATP